MFPELKKTNLFFMLTIVFLNSAHKMHALEGRFEDFEDDHLYRAARTLSLEVINNDNNDGALKLRRCPPHVMIGKNPEPQRFEITLRSNTGSKTIDLNSNSKDDYLLFAAKNLCFPNRDNEPLIPERYSPQAMLRQNSTPQFPETIVMSSKETQEIDNLAEIITIAIAAGNTQLFHSMLDGNNDSEVFTKSLLQARPRILTLPDNYAKKGFMKAVAAHSSP